MILKSRLLAVLLGSSLALVPFAINAEVVVIIKANSSIGSLTSKQVAGIFLQKVSSFPDGSPAIPMDLPDDSNIRHEFYEKAAQKSPKQLKAYWAKRIFTGKGKMNEVRFSEMEVKKWVAARDGRVAYVSPGVVDDSVSVLLRLP